jgi:tRNA(Ile)-lysidine synthase
VDEALESLLQKFSTDASPHLWRDVHVVVALSGGPDSVALLRATVELKHVSGGKGNVFAVHVNHKLRGAESDCDAAWCGRLCDELGVSLQVLSAEVEARALADGDGLESAAREERYRVLTDAAEARGARYLFMGHTRNDHVETIVFRLLRGTGIRGLAGIPAIRTLTPSLTLCRPLIRCTRDEVLAYLAERGQPHRLDSSNTDRAFMRNRIRTELLPLLRTEYNAGLDEALVRLAAQAGELQAFVETQAKETLEAARKWTSAVGFAISTVALHDTPPLLVGEAIRLAWREAGLPEQAMTREWWNDLTRLTRRGASNRVLNLPGNVRAELYRGEVLVIERDSSHPGNPIAGL